MAASVAAPACAEASPASPIIASPNRSGATIASIGIAVSFPTLRRLLIAKLEIIHFSIAKQTLRIIGSVRASRYAGFERVRHSSTLRSHGRNGDRVHDG